MAQPDGRSERSSARRLLRLRFATMRDCWCRCCRHRCMCAVWNGFRLWCGSSPRKRANSGPAAISCSHALSRCCSIEALRLTQRSDAPPGLLRGLGDARLAEAIRQMHGDPARPWTVAQLAKQAALSRSGFFDRFTRNVGLPPMEYLLAWRMAIAKELLRQHDMAIAEVAERIGYGSASTFSTAFSRYVGQPPGRYARKRAS